MTNCTIIHKGQHLLKHNAGDIGYRNEAHPEVSNVKQAVDAALAGVVPGEVVYDYQIDDTLSPYSASNDGDAFINVDSTNGPVIINLPAITNKRTFTIIDSAYAADSNSITVNPNGAETIDNTDTLVLQAKGIVMTLRGNGNINDWKII